MKVIEIFPENDTSRTFTFTADGTFNVAFIPNGVFTDPLNVKMVLIEVSRGIGSNATMGIRPTATTPADVTGEYIILTTSLTIVPVLQFFGNQIIDLLGDSGSTCFYRIVGAMGGDGVVANMAFPSNTGTANTWTTNTVQNIAAGDSGNIEAVVIYHAYDVSAGTPSGGYRGVGHTGVTHIHQRGGHFFRIVPVDNNDQYEFYRGTSGGGNFGLGHECGYIKKGYGYVAQELESITPSTTESQWNDLDVTSQTADNAIVAVGWKHRPNVGGDGLFESLGQRGNLRQQGVTDLLLNNSSVGLCSSLDSDQVLETWVTTPNSNYYIEGYLTKRTVIKTQNAIVKTQNALVKIQ